MLLAEWLLVAHVDDPDVLHHLHVEGPVLHEETLVCSGTNLKALFYYLVLIQQCLTFAPTAVVRGSPAIQSPAAPTRLCTFCIAITWHPKSEIKNF